MLVAAHVHGVGFIIVPVQRARHAVEIWTGRHVTVVACIDAGRADLEAVVAGAHELRVVGDTARPAGNAVGGRGAGVEEIGRGLGMHFPVVHAVRGRVAGDDAVNVGDGAASCVDAATRLRPVAYDRAGFQQGC